VIVYRSPRTRCIDTVSVEQQVASMKGSRRDFIRRALFGGMVAGLTSRAAFTSAEIESRPVDRRRFGRLGADVSILGLGLGAAFMDAFEHRLMRGIRCSNQRSPKASTIGIPGAATVRAKE
jgi:hypothetical protein